MTGLYIVLGFAAIGIVAWLVTSGIWMITRWVGRATHVDERVDHFFDVDGGMDEADYIKFKEQHPHGGRG
jgi:hypothetical protein